MFATAIYLFLDSDQKKLWVSNAGHPSILIRHKDDRIDQKGKASGAPLGILPDVDYWLEEIQLQSGDWVLLYTDGATEPKDRNRTEFGWDRLSNAFAKIKGAPNELLESLDKEISRFTQGAPPHDDLTFLTIQMR